MADRITCNECKNSYLKSLEYPFSHKPTCSKGDPQCNSDDTSLGEWVYCSQHLGPHLSGWCTINLSDKLGLGPFKGSHHEQAKAAAQKCRHLGLRLEGEGEPKDAIARFRKHG